MLLSLFAGLAIAFGLTQIATFATTIYLLPMMAWFNRGKWIANVASTVLFVAFTYFLFVKLEVRLPQGVLPF